MQAGFSNLWGHKTAYYSRRKDGCGKQLFTTTLVLHTLNSVSPSKRRWEVTSMQNYMNFSLWTELYRTEQWSFTLAEKKILSYKLLLAWEQRTGLWYETTSDFNAKWEFTTENYRIIDQVNIYKGNLCQISDVMVRLLAPAEAEQSKQKDALRRQQWMRIPLVPTLATCSPLHAGHMPGGPAEPGELGRGRQEAADSLHPLPSWGNSPCGLSNIVSWLLSSAPALQNLCKTSQDLYGSALTSTVLLNFMFG